MTDTDDLVFRDRARYQFVEDGSDPHRVDADFVEQSGIEYPFDDIADLRHVVTDSLHDSQVTLSGEVFEAGRFLQVTFQRGGMRPCTDPCQPIAGVLVTSDQGEPQQVVQAAAVDPYVDHFCPREDRVKRHQSAALILPIVSAGPTVGAKRQPDFHVQVFR
ncbi:hypothetical protein D3C87_1711660 [compost metagenome]